MTLTLLRGGRIHTAADPDATALAFDGSTVSWIGGEHALSVVGRPDRVIDLAGALVVPGFVDAHVHVTDAGLSLTGLELAGTRSLAQCLDAIGRYGRAHPDGVLWGHGWDEHSWPENRPPSRAELDAVVGARRAYLSRIDVHSALISSPLAAAITDGRTLPGWSESGPISRAAHAAVRGFIRGALPTDQRRAAHLAFLSAASAQGIVEVHECAAADDTGRADLDALLALDGPIPVRGYLAAAVTEPQRALSLLAETGAQALGGDLVIDGAIGSRTAALSNPYLDDPSTSGVRYLGLRRDHRSPRRLHPGRGAGRASMPSVTTPSALSVGRCAPRRNGWGTTGPSGLPVALTASNTPRCPTTRPSRRWPRPALSPACNRCSTPPGAEPTACTPAGSVPSGPRR